MYVGSFILALGLLPGCGDETPPPPPDNPVPAVSSLSPDQIVFGGAEFTLTVNGSGFVSGSVVQWNGENRPTTFMGRSSRLEATISAADIASARTAEVTVFNPTPGGGTSGAVTFTIIAVARFAYVANTDDNTVSMYTVDASTGQLRHNGYVAAGNFPRGVGVDPFGRFAYVANRDSDDVSGYTIDATTGALTSVGAAVAAGDGPYSVTVDPSGRFA